MPGGPGSGAAAPEALRVGLCSPLSWGFLDALIRRIQAEPDAPPLAFMQGATHAVVEATARGEIDVGFVYGRHEDARLRHEALWREPLVVLMPAGHPLARDGMVAAAALRAERFLVAGDQAERDLQADILRRAIGADPPEVMVAPVDRATLAELVGLGYGLALAPASAVAPAPGGLAARPIEGPLAAVAFHAMWRAKAGGDARVERLVGLARAHAAAWRCARA